MLPYANRDVKASKVDLFLYVRLLKIVEIINVVINMAGIRNKIESSAFLLIRYEKRTPIPDDINTTINILNLKSIYYLSLEF